MNTKDKRLDLRRSLGVNTILHPLSHGIQVVSCAVDTNLRLMLLVATIMMLFGLWFYCISNKRI
jgi:hypothetical protein